MHDFWIISTVDMTYTRSQNCANMMVGTHGIQTFELVVVVLLLLLLLFVVLVSTSAHPYYFGTSGLSKYTSMLAITSPCVSSLICAFAYIVIYMVLGIIGNHTYDLQN